MKQINDVMRATINACFKLTNTRLEFINAVKESTGLLSVGINKIEYIQQLASKYTKG